MTLIERFLKYVSFDTQSDDNSGVTPSTPKQMVFAQYLRSELEQLGFEEISLDENGYLFATLPANTDKPVPTIGFIAHMDTSPDTVSYTHLDVYKRQTPAFPVILCHTVFNGVDRIIPTQFFQISHLL